MVYVRRLVKVLTGLLVGGAAAALPATTPMAATLPTTAHVADPGANTTVSIHGTQFWLNGRVTSPRRPAEGLLLNSRMVLGIFDDENPATVGLWAYPDTHVWDPQRNTNEFIAALPSYAAHGVKLVVVGLQGGCPYHPNFRHCGGSTPQPWIVTAFNADGSLKPAWMSRLDQVIRAADANGMVVNVQLFDRVQNLRVADQVAAVNTITDFLVSKHYTNILVEAANECDVGPYSAYLFCGTTVIEQVQTRSKGMLLVSTSYAGGRNPDADVVALSDFVLLHGNGQTATQVTAMVNKVRSMPAYQAHPKPIVFNEDSTSLDNMNAAVAAGTSWGYLDIGQGDYINGFQSAPVNWTINTPLKEDFFAATQQLDGTQSVIVYTGPAAGDDHDAIKLSARLTDLAGTPFSRVPLIFSLGSQTCPSTTDDAGIGSCELTLSQLPGTYVVSASFGGTSTVEATTKSTTFTVTREEAALENTSDATIARGTSAHLSAVLTEDGLIPLPNRFVSLSLGVGAGAASCSATTDHAGTARCTISHVTQTLGATSVTATFLGDTLYRPASATASVQIVATSSDLMSTGPNEGDYDDAVEFTARLVDGGDAPISDATLAFGLGPQTCAATTDASGIGSCSIIPNVAAGSYPLSVAFAGTTGFQPSRVTQTFVVKREETTIAVRENMSIAKGSAADVSATLLEDGTVPIVGRGVLVTIGGGPASHCTALTDQAGHAHCATDPITQKAGSTAGTISFAGDERYLPASASFTVQVVSPTPSPSMAPATLGQTGHSWDPAAALLPVGAVSLLVGVLLARRRNREEAWRNQS